VVASDAPSNPYDKFLIGELVSDPFVIANTSPKLEVTGNRVNGKWVEAQFRVSVTTGRIATGEFSIDGGEWNLVFPADGIADSALEEYRITTPELSVGEHLLGIRASDGDEYQHGQISRKDSVTRRTRKRGTDVGLFFTRSPASSASSRYRVTVARFNTCVYV
jgi:hypothetical protein